MVLKIRKLEDKKAIIFAVIKMMLIDGVMDKREIKKIKQIYSFLYSKKLSQEDLKNMIFKVTQERDFSTGESIVAKKIADSIKTSRSRLRRL